MVIDPSALVAMVVGEPERTVMIQACLDAPIVRLSAAGFVESAAVLDRRSAGAARDFDELLDRLEVAVTPVSVEQARIAREAYRRFGRGSGHPAALNFGDCFSYALAVDCAEPLLFKGADFAHSDVVPVL